MTIIKKVLLSSIAIGLLCCNFPLEGKGGPSTRSSKTVYTPLMNAAGDVARVRELIEKEHVDINEHIWQNRWGHYVTALDCAIWSSKNGNKGAEAAIKYLRSKGAKTADELGIWSKYKGRDVK